MMKMKLLFSMLLLFMGVSMQAQSVAEEQMDEHFNDSTLLPYGWFTEGWKVKDGVIRTQASSSFDFSSMGQGEGSPDISELLSSLMGGGDEDNYLLTPPLVVNEGETLVFSAKKEKTHLPLPARTRRCSRTSTNRAPVQARTSASTT